MACAAHAVATTNSASIVDKMMVGCSIDDYEVAPKLNTYTYPEVLFRSSKSPA